MNFVLHHELAARDVRSPLAAIGAMLPDLWRMADRRVRARDVDRAIAAAERAEVAALLEGVRHHLDADAWFHASPAFREGEARTAAALRGVEAPKLVLFAHVAWELCLDGALVRRRGLEPILSALRDGVARASARGEGSADEAPLERVATLHHFSHAPRAPRAPRAPHDLAARRAFDDRVRRLLEAIARGPWVDGYRSGAGITARLEGVRARFALPPLDPSARPRLEAALDALAPEADAALDAIVARAG